MSDEHLDLARRFIDLGRAGDWDRQLEFLAEDVVYRPIAEVTETGEYRGREGYRHYVEGFLESDWASDLRFEATSFREYGDAVIVRIQLTGHGRASGLDFAARVFQVLTFRGNEIVRIEDFLDRYEALKAAGADNVALARSAIGDLQRLFDLFDEDIVWDATGYSGNQLPDFMGVDYGKEAVIRRIRRYLAPWQDFRFEVDEIVDAGDQVLLVVHETARGKTSEVPIEHRYCQVWTFKGGRIVRAASFSTKADALAAVDLLE